MKTLGFCLLILSLSVLQLKATGPLNYETLAQWGTAGGTCTSKSVVRSPVALLAEKCEPYETFEIDLKNPSGSATFDNDKGSYILTYTDGTMKVNSHSFTSTDILFRYPSEHKLPGQSTSIDSIEVQILLNAASGSDGVLSFIFLDEGSSGDKHYQGFKNSKDMLDVFTAASYSSPNFSPTLDFVALTKQFTQKMASDSLYLNLFTYAGTYTYPETSGCGEVLWYVYGSPIIAQTSVFTAMKAALTDAAGSSFVTLNTDNSGNARARTHTNDLGGDGNFAAIRLCYTGYFKNYMNYNYGLWFGVVIIVFWFIINLMLSEKPIKDSEYQENVWTNHPLYSIYHVGNDLFTRKTRMALLLGTLTIHALFSSVWYRRTDDPLRKSNIIVYAVYSMLIDWAFIYIIGSMLRAYYVAKHQYYKTREEAWEQRSQNRIFLFYFCIFLCAVVLWPFCVWNMSELHPEKDDRASNYWVASFFIGLGLEFLIVDPLVCLLAKSITPLRNLMKHRGYFYDNLCHETYLDHLKVD